jgi:hypothetical protein
MAEIEDTEFIETFFIVVPIAVARRICDDDDAFKLRLPIQFLALLQPAS